MNAAAKAVIDALTELAARHPDDFATLYEIGTAFSLLGPQTANALGDPAPVCERTLAFARDLAQRFDREGRAHAVLAFTLANCGGDDDTVLREAARCATLAPDDLHCRDLHVRTSSHYLAPYCTGDEIAAGVGVREIDSASAYLRSGDFAAIWIEGEDLTAELTPSGRDHLRTLTSSPRALAFVLGDEVLATVRVDEPLDTDRLNLPKLNVSRICTKIERRTLAADQQLPP